MRPGELNGGVMNRFEFDICTPVAHPAIAGHFPGNPIVPGVLILDQLLTAMLELNGMEIVRFEHVKFLSALRPDEPAHVVCEIDGDHAKFQISLQRHAKDTMVASGKMLMQRQNNETLD